MNEFKSFFKKPNKHKNIKCTCQLGHLHDSRGEAGYCNTLKYLKLAKEIKSFEIQKKFPLKVEGMTFANHIVDFLVTLNDGTIEVREFKAHTTMTQTWRIKHKIFLRNYPEIPYKIVTQGDLIR